MLCWHLSANTLGFYVKAVWSQWCQMADGWLVHMKMSQKQLNGSQLYFGQTFMVP